MIDYSRFEKDAFLKVTVEDHIAPLRGECRQSGVEHPGGQGDAGRTEGVELGSWIPAVEASGDPVQGQAGMARDGLRVSALVDAGKRRVAAAEQSDASLLGCPG